MKRINPRLLLCVAGGAALLCLVIWMAAVLLLPGIVRGKVLKQANIAGVDLSGVVVESVGLRGMVVRDVVAKGGNVRAVIPLLRADYSLPGIMKGDFNTASVSGSRVEVEIAGKAFLLTDLSGVLQMDESDTASADEWVFRGETRFEGNFLDLEARVNPKTGRGAATLRCRELAVASFLKFFDNSFTGLMNGNLEMVVEAEIDDWQLQKSRFVLDSKRLHIFYSGFETALALKAGGEADGAFESYSLHADVNLDRFEHDQLSISEPFEVRVDMDSETGMKAEFSSLAIHQPPGLTVDHLKAQMVAKPLSPEVRFSGDLTFHEISSLRRMPVIQFSGTAVSKAEGVEWTIEADTAGPIQAVLDETTLSAGIHAKLNASGVGEKGTARVHIQADNFRAGGDEWLLQFSRLGVDGRISPGPKLTYRGVIQLEKGEFAHKETGIRVNGVSGSVPYTSSGHVDGLPLTIEQVDFSGIKLQKIQAEASVSGRTAIAGGSADLSDGRLKMRFNARADSGATDNLFHIDFEIPATDLGAGSDLGSIIPAMTGFRGGGGIGLLGKIQMLPDSGLSSMAAITLTDVRLSSKQAKLNVSGLSGTIRFDRLHELRTLPSQVLRFQSLSLGPAKILDGRVQAQLDGLTSGLMERLDFSFSGGRVTTTAFQFPAQDTGMEIDFICDRLQLADMLNMITGRSNATGQGTISGVLPVRIGSDGIHFKEAHLATSPGDTGILRVEDAADMTGGILLAEESIRDFSYEWAKVNVEESRDHLNMVVQLSGKPRRKLPLKFDPAKRDFVRDPSGERLVDLKGLLLELKFVDIDINALLREAGLH